MGCDWAGVCGWTGGGRGRRRRGRDKKREDEDEIVKRDLRELFDAGQLLAHLRHLGTGIHGYPVDPAQSTHSVLFLSLAQPWEELQLLSLTADR